MAYTRAYPVWKDFPDTTTPILAAKMQNIEDGIVAAYVAGAGGLVNADIAAGAAIVYAKLALANSIVSGDIVDGTIVNADINAAAAIAASKIAGGVGMQLICDSLLVAPGASFDTNTILGGVLPTGYKDLRLRLTGRGDNASAVIVAGMRFNNDSAANYYDQRIENSAATTVVGAENNGATSLKTGSLTAASTTAGYPGSIVADIFDYNGTTFFKQFMGMSLYQLGTGTGSRTDDVNMGTWVSAVAITRLQLIPSVGNFLAGTRFTLWGLT